MDWLRRRQIDAHPFLRSAKFWFLQNEHSNSVRFGGGERGKFKSPRPGIYFFSFTGLASFPASSSIVPFGVSLYLNGGQIGSGLVNEGNTVDGQRNTLTLQSTLNLKKGDQVWDFGWRLLFSQEGRGGYLIDSSYHYNHFTGFMLKEDIVASL
jgi:hypothetical protein